MTSETNNRWISGKNVLVLILGMLIMYVGVTVLVDKRFNEIEDNTKDKIASQEVLLTAIAEITGRNGADAITESIVKDCSLNERVQFDNLLGKLNQGLSPLQLVELERLFGRCGSFFSERKSVMVARLAREIDIYDDYVQQLEILTDTDLEEQYSVSLWQELSTLEQKRSELLSELVLLQDQIITTLLAGMSIDSEEMKEILFNVNEVQGTLVVVNSQASDLRSRLISI